MTTEKKKIDCAFCHNDMNGCHFHTKNGSRRKNPTVDTLRVQCQFCMKEQDGKCQAKHGSCGDHPTVKLTKRRHCFKFVFSADKKKDWTRGRDPITEVFREHEHRNIIKKFAAPEPVEASAAEEKEESRIILPEEKKIIMP